MRAAANGPLAGILGVSDDPLVSVDYKGDPRSSVVDADSTMVIDDMVKVVAWYDNENGYTSQMVRVIKYMAENFK